MGANERERESLRERERERERERGNKKKKKEAEREKRKSHFPALQSIFSLPLPGLCLVTSRHTFSKTFVEGFTGLRRGPKFAMQ